MPYPLLRGTRCRVITPQGRIIDPYVCRENTTFTDEQTKPCGLHLQFERNGYRLIAAVQAVIRVEVSCADCGRILSVPSLWIIARCFAAGDR